VPILYIVIKDFEQSFLKGGKQKDKEQGLGIINNNHHNGHNGKNGRQKLEEQESKVNI
jgi:hypothetical protein